MERVAFIVPTRNKADWCGTALKCALAQNYSPMTVVFSDQGSTDGTRQILDHYKARYNGPNEVVILDCPEQSETGIAGLNQHFNWLFKNVDADLFVLNSADDWSPPERTEKVVKAWRETGASCIGNMIQFKDPTKRERENYVELTAFEGGSRMIGPREHIAKKVGSSAFLAYERRLFERFGPFETTVINDITVPLWAAIDRGFYFIAEPLGVFLKHASATNAGLGGRMRAAEAAGDKTLHLQINEMAHYQMMMSYVDCLATVSREVEKLHDQGYKVPPVLAEAVEVLAETIYNQGIAWTAVRNALTTHHIPPLPCT